MVKKYIYLLLLFIKNSFIQDLTYRTDFFVSVLTDCCSCLVQVFFVKFIFQHVSVIGKWSFEDFMVYFGCAFIMEGMYMFFFFNGHTRISLKVMNGELDYFLTKPLSEIFYLSFCSSNIGSGISNLALGTIYLMYGLKKLKLDVTMSQLMVFIIFFVGGFILYFAISFIINCLSFYFLHTGTLFNLFLNMTELSRYPGDMFPKGIQLFITYIVPFQFIAIIPAKYLLGEIEFRYIIVVCFLVVGAIELVNIIYCYARKAYNSGRG